MKKISEEIRSLLKANIDWQYRKFTASLIPNTPNILGVRIPILRAIAKQFSSRNDIDEFIRITPTSLEEALLQGMIIGRLKMPISEILQKVELFIPRITNWSICDIFCGDLKIARKHREIVWQFILSYVRSNEEFSARFALIMMLKYFIDTEHLTQIFAEILNVKCEKYYTKMAIAWLLSMCYVKFPHETFEFLQTNISDKELLAKTVRKILDSYQISNENKEKIAEYYREKRKKR
ncbi:MAG: DNA alkylation repair protein [Alphaproteobacteria bacterium]|nr:DNA alkylation repair protein [Alphaproteobacteria bacterium]